MDSKIGLKLPISALLLFGLLFNPWWVKILPKTGWASVLISPQVFFLLASTAIIFSRRLSAEEIGIQRSKVGLDALRGIGIGLLPGVLTLTVAGVLTIADRYLHFLPRPLFDGTAIPMVENPRLLVILFLAPITEELFFRGILLKALLEQYSRVASVLLSSVIFAASHGGFPIGPLLLGLCTAPMAIFLRSIVPGMAFHAVCNAYGPIMLRWFPNLFQYLSFFFR